jgi:hypothetical protein
MGNSKASFNKPGPELSFVWFALGVKASCGERDMSILNAQPPTRIITSLPTRAPISEPLPIRPCSHPGFLVSYTPAVHHQTLLYVNCVLLYRPAMPRATASTESLFEFWEFVNCGRCHRPYEESQGQPPSLPFWLTECGHIVCNNHLSLYLTLEQTKYSISYTTY